MNNDEWKSIWNKNDHKDWIAIEQQYYDRVKKENTDLERELEEFQISNLWGWSTEEFKDFLYNKYFVWKYTAPNRLTTTRNKLREVTEPELSFVLKAIRIIYDALSEMNKYDINEIKVGMLLITMIPGLGIAGASGLLSILFPDFYGTVDQFVVKALEDAGVDTQVCYPESLTIKDALFLEEVMFKKAKELNEINNIDYWTPRKIDKVLWTYRSEIGE